MSIGKLSRPIEILLVEDNRGDVRLIEEALRNNDILYNLHVVIDGMEAMKFLKKNGKQADVVQPRPDIILLDLNLPKKDGREVLSEIKTEDDLKSIPVIVLTSSEAEQDITDTYNNHANCYISKPVQLDQFTGVVKGIKDFWLYMVKLPPKEE
jgi:CheY-like chemotaxis protein